MNITVQFFGVLAEITGSRQLSLQDVSDVQVAKSRVLELYPQVASFPFIIAKDNQIIHGNADLKEGNRLAFMPPFSGG